MRKVVVGFVLALMSAKAWCSDHTFMFHDPIAQKTLVSFGDPHVQYSPCSSFKIPLAVIGFESKILTDTYDPEWPFDPNTPEEYAPMERMRQALNPTTWMTASAPWYSQVITHELGMERFAEYVRLMKYGNMDVSGDPEKGDGLLESWLSSPKSSSLKISAMEQLAFINKLARNELPDFSVKAQLKTRAIICLKDLHPLENGWTLYGKTGTGRHFNEDGTKAPFFRGWFVGWVEKGDRRYTFVSQMNNVPAEKGAGGPIAKEAALALLKGLLADK